MKIKMNMRVLKIQSWFCHESILQALLPILNFHLDEIVSGISTTLNFLPPKIGLYSNIICERNKKDIVSKNSHVM